MPKKPVKKKSAKKPVPKQKDKSEKNAQKAVKTRYVEAIGRRKTAVARVRIFPKEAKGFLVNEKQLASYFPTRELQQIAIAPLGRIEEADKMMISVKVKGGGIHAQAEAVRHGIARALVAIDADARKVFKKAGFLTRDPRMRERKKPGLKRARRAPQWKKR